MIVTRWRSSMILLGICVVAVLIGALRLLLQQPQQPPGSSLSAAPDGALALYTWLDDLGFQPQRLADRTVDGSVTGVLIIEPEVLLDSSARASLDAVADRGGTLVLAGDDVQWLLASRAFGLSVEPAAPSARMTTPDGSALPFAARFRVHADAAQPLLLDANGQWLGLQMPYRRGSLIVLATPAPLTNVGLRDDPTARFVFRAIVSPLSGGSVVFDESGRIPAAASAAPVSVNQLLFQTPPGLAIVYAALLTFAYLFLAGRRLGPALAERAAADAPRTMYEHVQMIASLYRAAGQLAAVRSVFERHYGRAARPPEMVSRITSARTEAELVSAVAAIEADDAR
jgi:hypothetical protein